jgi:hypothetical protein
MKNWLKRSLCNMRYLLVLSGLWWGFAGCNEEGNLYGQNAPTGLTRPLQISFQSVSRPLRAVNPATMMMGA